MVKPEWGTKRTCPKCGTRFYDLQAEDPVTCISCGTAWAPEPVLKSKQPLPFGEPEKKEKEPASDSDLAEDLEIDEDSDNAEEDVDLGGDDDLGVAGRDKEEES
ncbi:hypothetical protein BSL82_15565 [Tardibacter chloracetimidivorans]|uniref:TIGR02300 family protein n=1 Tax=Tardibacter chloracetimidivorans TaxID=1921510 RepID=A0A1L3ZZZ8_9SPHN|nr:FYDLN acid domain-containing protein [Tardibacter chloracetimidivorans]API61207.1 hypothetical protein BSL82_15565 [Tardibacter chloracetimidivorans]